ncbi:unnamed protein product [Rhizophagus irregularis]|nr:unnamed protein product [Rhizophagus irregularis]
MVRLRFRYPDLYADDSLCPNCGIFMETLEHLFTCSPDTSLSNDTNPIPMSHRNKITELLDCFINRLARKATTSPKACMDFNTLLSLCPPLDFLLSKREIYHQLWRPRCKMKSLKDKAMNISPALLRMTKSSDFSNFRFDTSPVEFSMTNESPTTLQASEWSSIGIFWTHSAIIRGMNWFDNLLDFLKSRTVLVRFKVLAYWIVGISNVSCASGVFSWSNGPTSPQASELGFILRVLRMLPQRSSIIFYVSRLYNSIFSSFQRSSSEKRIRFLYYTLWMAILNCSQDSFIDCSFQVIKDNTADPIFSRCLALTELAKSSDPSPSFELLLGSCPSQRLLVVSLCTGVPLLVDPVSFWRNFSDM